MFRKKVDALIKIIPSIDLTGEQSLGLYRKLKDANTSFDNSAEISLSGAEEFKEVANQCILVVDPEELYLKCTNDSAQPEKTRFNALKECIERLGEHRGLGYYYAGRHSQHYNRYTTKIAAARELWVTDASSLTYNVQ